MGEGNENKNDLILNPTLWNSEKRKRKRIMDIAIAIISVLFVFYIFIYGPDSHAPYQDMNIQSIVMVNPDNTNNVLTGDKLETTAKWLNSLRLYSPIRRDISDYRYKLVFNSEDNQNHELYIGDGWVKNDQGVFKTLYEFTDYIDKNIKEESGK